MFSDTDNNYYKKLFYQFKYSEQHHQNILAIFTET